MNPRVLFAFDVIVAICLFQFKSDVKVMPRYFADVTLSSAVLWRRYRNRIGFLFRVTQRLSHLAVLNSIFQVFSQMAVSLGRFARLCNLSVWLFVYIG